MALPAPPLTSPLESDPPESPAQRSACLNCGTQLTDTFCPHCGQRAGDAHLSVRDLLHELAAEHFGLDTKVARTLVALVRHPGRLTLEFLAGRRARYLPPLRLYVSLSVLYFLFASLSNGLDPSKGNGVATINTSDTAATAAAVAAALDSAGIKPSSVEGVAQDTLHGSAVSRFFRRDLSHRLADAKSHKGDTTAAPGSATNGVVRATTKPSSRDTVHGNAIVLFFKRRFYQRMSYTRTHQAEATRQISETFHHHLPDALFLLVPGLALALAALYYGSHRYYAEHLVFAMHFQAFSFAALTIALLPIPFLGLVIGVAIVAYLFLSLRAVYGESIAATTGKVAVIALGYGISLTLIMAVVGLTAFLFS
jgi:hypothetical protein